MSLGERRSLPTCVGEEKIELKKLVSGNKVRKIEELFNNLKKRGILVKINVRRLRAPGKKRVWRRTNHKLIGRMYFYLGSWAGLCGFGYSVLIRINNMRPGTGFLSPEVYLRVITTHAILIIFFFVMPVLIGGFGNWLVPILLGCPDMLLPRVNAFSFWLLVPSLIYVLAAGRVEGGIGTG